MDRSMRRRLALALSVVGLVLLPHGVAFAEGDVSVSLTANRVTMSQGKEAFTPADQARPGEVIEYRATYRNAGNAAVKQFAATLPIPSGLEYLPKTAMPTKLLASVDGKTFAPLPLTRRVKSANGKFVVVEVPASEYRALRWSIGTLAASSSVDVRARVRVAPLEPVAVATSR